MTETHLPTCPLHPKPSCGTASAKAYYQALQADLDLFHFFIHIVLHSDFFGYVAKQALDGKEWKDQDPVTLARATPGPMTKRLRESRQELLEMFLARSTDNFQHYVVDVIREVLRKEPAILKSKESSLSLDTVLGFDSMEELVRHVIERKVTALTYQGYVELQDWAAGKGIPLASTNTAAISELVALRNIIIHNRGVVDEKYLRYVPNCPFAIGAIRNIEVEEFSLAIGVLDEAVQEIDAAVASKFGLATAPLEFTKPREDPPTHADDN